jgi:hypothetical protein
MSRGALGLDVTDLGRDIIRIDGTAEHVPGFPAADQVPEYVVKYAERMTMRPPTRSELTSAAKPAPSRTPLSASPIAHLISGGAAVARGSGAGTLPCAFDTVAIRAGRSSTQSVP